MAETADLRLYSIILVIAFNTAVSAQSDPGPRSLSLAWEFPMPRETPQAIVEDTLKRPLLYVATKNGGLVVLTAPPKQAPKELARLGVDQFENLHVMHLTQSGEDLFLALGDLFDAKGAPAGLAIVSVKEPKRPRVTAVWKSTESLNGSATVLVDGDIAYLGAMSAGVMIFDVSRRDRIQLLCHFQPDIHFPVPNPRKIHHPNARGLAKQGELLFVAYDAGGLRVLDVADPRRPREIGRYLNPKFPNKPQAFNNLVIDGQKAYVAVDYAGLEILDIRDPRAMKQLGWWNPWQAETLGNVWFNSPGHTNQIEWQAKSRQVWMSAGDSELQIVDVSKPAQPRLVGVYGAPRDKRGVWGVTLSTNRAYLSYITATIPFQGTWSGIKAVE